MNVCGTVHPSHFQRHRHRQQCKSSERLSADLCDKYGLSVRFLVVTEKDFMVQDSTSVTLISSWNPSV